MNENSSLYICCINQKSVTVMENNKKKLTYFIIVFFKNYWKTNSQILLKASRHTKMNIN